MMRAKRTVMNAWRTVAIAVVALSALSAASAQYPNLVQDPSFETTTGGTNYGSRPTTWFAGDSFGGSPNGSPNSPGEPWYVFLGSVDLTRVSNAGHPNGGGNQYVGLNGNNRGGIRQRVTVSQGGLYNFSFYYGGNVATSNGAPPDSNYEMRAEARIVDANNPSNVVHSAIVSWSINAAGGRNNSWISTPYTAQFPLSLRAITMLSSSRSTTAAQTATATLFQPPRARALTASISRWCQSLRRWSRWARV
jgi:hypothetical protein